MRPSTLRRLGAGSVIPSSKRHQQWRLICAAAMAVIPAMSFANTDQWVGGSSDWSTASNWSPANAPVAGDIVNVTSTLGVTQTITYDYGGEPTLGSLTLDLTNGGGTNTELLDLAADNFLYANNEYIGDSGPGGSNGAATFNQSNGGNTVHTGVYLGYNSTDNGTYILSGGNDFGLISANIYVGYQGTGNFVHTDTQNSVSGQLYLGYFAGAVGNYVIGGTAELNVSGAEYDGYSGVGTFNQSGGANLNQGLYLGYNNNGSTGTYNLGGTGTLNCSQPAYVGYNGTGIVNQSGGTSVYKSAIYLGYGTTAVGAFNLSGTSSLANFSGAIIGYAGVGSLNQTGGTCSITGFNGTLCLGYTATALGIYNLSGTGSLSVSEGEYVGYSGAGYFNQTGGSNVVGPSVSIGYLAGSKGTYTLSGGTVSGYVEAGYSGTGLFNQSGGTLAYGFVLGVNPVSTGTYVLTGGTVTTTGGGTEIIGAGGTGIFNQTGGVNTISQGERGGLFLGGGPNGQNGGNGVYILGGAGTLDADVNSYADGSEFVGYTGNGVFNQSGGSNTLDFDLYLAYTEGTTGTYILSGTGSLSVSDASSGNPREYIGNVGIQSSTSFNQLQVDGTVSLGGVLDLLLASSYSPQIGDSFPIIAGSSENVIGTFSLIVQSESYSSGQFRAEYDPADNPDGVDVVFVPEPSGLALLLAGSMLLSRRWPRSTNEK